MLMFNTSMYGYYLVPEKLVDGPVLKLMVKINFYLQICQSREDEQVVVTLHQTLFHVFCVKHALRELHHQEHAGDGECFAND